MNNIIVESDKLIVTRVTEELLLTDKLKDKYIFWEEFEEAGVLVWFNTTDYTNKDLIDSWNRVKTATINATNLLEKLIA